MKKLEKVNLIEVKRCFVVSQLIRNERISGRFLKFLNVLFKREFLKDISIEEFEYRLKKVKEKVVLMNEKELDKIISKEWKKRLVAYNNTEWYFGEFSPDEMGVWRRAGEMPLVWTNGSLSETARYIQDAVSKKNAKFSGRAGHAISNILKTNVSIIQKEKYLLPILFQCDTGTKGRKRLKRKMKYDIDDGCMRSIALTISGAEKIKAYVGFPKK